MWRDESKPVVQGSSAQKIDSPLLEHGRALLETEPDNNYLSLLENGYDALVARIHLIRAAQHHIAIQTIIWANDETGRLFMYELIQAAKRGVRVQFDQPPKCGLAFLEFPQTGECNTEIDTT